MYNTDLFSNITSQVQTYQKGNWINMINPTENEIEDVCKNLAIKQDFIRYSLDYEEKARVDVEDDGTITGVHKKHRDPIGVTALIANSTVPPIAVRAEIITEEDKDVLKIASYSQDKILSHSMVPASNPHPSAEAVPGVLFSMY